MASNSHTVSGGVELVSSLTLADSSDQIGEASTRLAGVRSTKTCQAVVTTKLAVEVIVHIVA